ncbi:hypothetical protein AB0I81_30315 [Nonomuraea sp. NPDC050404]|uniref:hypothetical protein n=1 Tax=Nonomuraea sp. NPDC050404 TaxID=3155783 RepID=UPI0033FDEC0E
MTWNSGPCIDPVPETVVAVLDAINARVGWPGGRRAPCVGHMVSDHRPIVGIDVDLGDEFVEVRVAGVLVGRGKRWTAIGNAYIGCLLPHTWPDSSSVSALHQGGAINAYQLHLLVLHGTHRFGCSSLYRRDRCPVCQGRTTR